MPVAAAGLPLAAAAAFWELFRLRAAELARASSADDPVYDELLEALRRVDEGLYLEFSTSGQPRELIITADGKAPLFGVARALVAQAPAVPGWAFFALKPRLGFPQRTTWEGLELSIADLWFEPLERPGSAELGLRIFVPHISDEHVDDAHSAVLRALEHGLGEEAFATEVQHVEVRSFGGHAPDEAWIALASLEEFIAWRKRQRN